MMEVAGTSRDEVGGTGGKLEFLAFAVSISVILLPMKLPPTLRVDGSLYRLAGGLINGFVRS